MITTNANLESKYYIWETTGKNGPFKIDEWVYENGRLVNEFLISWGHPTKNAAIAELERRGLSCSN